MEGIYTGLTGQMAVSLAFTYTHCCMAGAREKRCGKDTTAESQSVDSSLPWLPVARLSGNEGSSFFINKHTPAYRYQLTLAQPT
jgi:hypothetical protein